MHSVCQGQKGKLRTWPGSGAGTAGGVRLTAAAAFRSSSASSSSSSSLSATTSSSAAAPSLPPLRPLEAAPSPSALSPGADVSRMGAVVGGAALASAAATLAGSAEMSKYFRLLPSGRHWPSAHGNATHAQTAQCSWGGMRAPGVGYTPAGRQVGSKGQAGAGRRARLTCGDLNICDAG